MRARRAKVGIDQDDLLTIAGHGGGQVDGGRALTLSLRGARNLETPDRPIDAGEADARAQGAVRFGHL